MRYEVYVDRLFFMHAGLHVLLLALTAKLGDYPVAWKRIATAAGLGSLLSLAALFWPVGESGMAVAVKTLLSTAGSYAMLPVAFGIRGRSQWTQCAASYTACICLVGGVLAAVEGIGHPSQNSLLLMASAACATVGGAWFIRKMRLARANPFWLVLLKEGEKSCRVTALMDSGNGLLEPVSKEPVCIVQKEVMQKLGLLQKPEKFRLVPYHSVGRQHGLLKAAAVEEMYLQKGAQKLTKRKVWLAASEQALSTSGRYQLLLHPALLEETMSPQKRADGSRHDIESGNAGKDAV